jgi:hypothetical protein
MNRPVHLIPPNPGGQQTNGNVSTYCGNAERGPFVGCGQWTRTTCLDCVRELHRQVLTRRLDLAAAGKTKAPAG